MSASVAWVVAIAALLLMLQLGVETKQLWLPSVSRRRCGACGRLVRRGRVCPCSDPAAG